MPSRCTPHQAVPRECPKAVSGWLAVGAAHGLAVPAEMRGPFLVWAERLVSRDPSITFNVDVRYHRKWYSTFLLAGVPAVEMCALTWYSAACQSTGTTSPNMKRGRGC